MKHIVTIVSLYFFFNAVIASPTIHPSWITSIPEDDQNNDDSNIYKTHINDFIYDPSSAESRNKLFETIRRGVSKRPKVEDSGNNVPIPKASTRNGYASEAYRWPEKRIPYEFNEKTDPNMKKTIMLAIDEIHNTTCIRLVPHTNERVYVKFTHSPDGCYSVVGYVKESYNINLEYPKCNKKRTVLHELMHVMGFQHEHTRSDRDDYITVFKDNIRSNCRDIFEKAIFPQMDNFGVPYDYNSVMHYDAYACSADTSKPMMVAKNDANIKMGGAEKLSENDILKINRMYHCEIPKETIDTKVDENTNIKDSETTTKTIFETHFNFTPKLIVGTTMTIGSTEVKVATPMEIIVSTYPDFIVLEEEGFVCVIGSIYCFKLRLPLTVIKTPLLY